MSLETSHENYIKELIEEIEVLDPVKSKYTIRLLGEELTRVQKKAELRAQNQAQNSKEYVKLTRKIMVPIDKYPCYNFIGMYHLLSLHYKPGYDSKEVKKVIARFTQYIHIGKCICYIAISFFTNSTSPLDLYFFFTKPRILLHRKTDGPKSYQHQTHSTRDRLQRAHTRPGINARQRKRTHACREQRP